MSGHIAILYVYDIGYGTHEESANSQYWHKQKFDQAQLLELVKRAYLAAYKAEMFDHKGKMPEYMTNLEHLFHHEAFGKAMEAMGFKLMEFEASVYVNGWAGFDSNSFRNMEDSSSATEQIIKFLLEQDKEV